MLAGRINVPSQTKLTAMDLEVMPIFPPNHSNIGCAIRVLCTVNGAILLTIPAFWAIFQGLVHLLIDFAFREPPTAEN